MFTNADKENAAVTMNRIDYKNRMLEILSDSNSYKQLNFNPVPTLQQKTKDFLRCWNSNSYLHKHTIRYIYLIYINLRKLIL